MNQNDPGVGDGRGDGGNAAWWIRLTFSWKILEREAALADPLNPKSRKLNFGEIKAPILRASNVSSLVQDWILNEKGQVSEPQNGFFFLRAAGQGFISDGKIIRESIVSPGWPATTDPVYNDGRGEVLPPNISVSPFTLPSSGAQQHVQVLRNIQPGTIPVEIALPMHEILFPSGGFVIRKFSLLESDLRWTVRISFIPEGA